MLDRTVSILANYKKKRGMRNEEEEINQLPIKLLIINQILIINFILIFLLY